MTSVNKWTGSSEQRREKAAEWQASVDVLGFAKSYPELPY